MKKAVSLLICAFMLALWCASAYAATDLTACSVSNGSVQAVAFADVVAPCSGTLLSFDWNAGDRVEAGTPMFELLTTRVTAPEDGTLRWLFVKPGDSADAAMSSYGAVAALEPALLERMHATYYSAPDEEECLHVHVGQMLWFKHDGARGTGIVVSTSGDSYEVEILTGVFDIDERISLYKDTSYDYNSRVGEGVVYKRDDLRVTGSGIVDQVLVYPGGAVKKGDTLFTLLSPDADIGASPVIKAPGRGVVSAVAVASGQQVWKGQMLARVSLTDRLEVVADVDEMDLRGLRVGDAVPVTLDTNAERVLTGTVTEISGLGITKQNAAYYTVHLRVDADGLMLGQSASVYLPRG